MSAVGKGSATATLYVDPAQLALAFARLQVGHSLIYAYGAPLDPGNATVVMVRTWQAEGKASCHQQGRDEAGRARNAVVKRAGESGGAGDGARDSLSAAIGAAIEHPRTRREALAMARYIRDLARAGRVMPSNAVLAEALNLRSRDRAQYLLKRLNQAGLISLWSRENGPRVVRITGTGFETANPYGQAPGTLAAAIRKAFA